MISIDHCRSLTTTLLIALCLFSNAANAFGINCDGENRHLPMAAEESSSLMGGEWGDLRVMAPNDDDGDGHHHQRQHVLAASTGTGLPTTTKVAFFGDQGLTFEAKEVLKMIKEWGADFVIHAGDFDYEDRPKRFQHQFQDILGKDCKSSNCKEKLTIMNQLLI